VPATSATATGLAQRYATAVFDLAKDGQKLDRVGQDLAGLVAAMAESADLKRLVESPVISRADQGKAILAIADKAGLDGLTRRFLGLLAEHRRLFALPGIAKAYGAMLAAHKGEIAAEVVSAVPLGEAELETLKTSIAGFVGQAVTVETRVDPALLGGVVVRVGSRMLDASLRTKLQQLEQTLKGGTRGAAAQGAA
jgi:F-type H+-transporting ATPase subunit delta